MNKEYVNSGLEGVDASAQASALETDARLSDLLALDRILHEQSDAINRLYDQGYEGTWQFQGLKPLTQMEGIFADVSYGLHAEARAAFQQRVMALAEDPAHYASVLALIESDFSRAGSVNQFHTEARKAAEITRLKNVAPEILAA